MGATESRPTYPTQRQWDDYKEEKLKELTKIEEVITKQKEEAIELQKELTKDIVTYMRECQDKSFLKRFVADNSACTQAKEKLLEDSMSLGENFYFFIVFKLTFLTRY
jgi:hypothetical protein